MRPHPLASGLPEMSAADYDRLLGSIRVNGLRVPLVTYEGMLLDGRHRQRACAELGIEPAFVEFTGTKLEAELHMLCLNKDRRHLTKEQLRKIVAAELKTDPARSDRAIAAKAGVSKNTVAAVRTGGQFDHPDKRIGLDGVEQPATKRGRNGRRVGLAPSHKTFDERVAEIRPLAAQGMSAHQIAAAIGVSDEHVNAVANKAKIPIPARTAGGKVRKLDPARLIDEVVTTLSAVARGIDRIKTVELSIDPIAARALFDELTGSAPNIKWLTTQLRRACDA